MEEDMRKLKITEGMAEDRKQEATHITSNPRYGKLGTLNEDDNDNVMKMMVDASGVNNLFLMQFILEYWC